MQHSSYTCMHISEPDLGCYELYENQLIPLEDEAISVRASVYVTY